MLNQPKSNGDKQQADAEQNKSSAPSISLPKGGGAIRGIGEKFAANPVTGTGSMTVPITTSPGRFGFGPQLALSYDSGAGNGPFGFGWTLSLPSITRKTDKGLPRYRDLEESDVFILSGAEDLVPVLVEDCGRWQRETLERTVEGVAYCIQRYRPRIEGLFARIERWTRVSDGDIHWRSISRDNITTFYGKTAESRIADPADPSRVFSWLICESFDDKGNVILYEYARENSAGVVMAQAHERNRTTVSRSANRYIKRIRYGNDRPHLVEPDRSKMKWHFEIVFDYDEGHYEELAPDEKQRQLVRASLTTQQDWSVRPDPFSSYRATFEVRTYRLCRRVLMFHHFPDDLKVEDYLVRSTDFTYEARPAARPIGSFLTAVTHSGYVLQSGETYLKKSLPPLEFEYSQAVIQNRIQTIDTESLENLPYGMDGANYQWVDLDGEGVSGILTEQADAWFYKPNLGDGRFGPIEQVAAKPSLAALRNGRQQLLDLAGDGQLDLVEFSGPTPGFFERTQDQRWEKFTPFDSLPNIRWDQPNLRFVDLNGDGHADVLITENEVLTWYPSLAEEGFGPAQYVHKPLDEEKGPKLVFADGTQTIFLADLSGDGLSDLVRIRNGEVCYWPNLGYGRFGAKVRMDNAPWFDAPDLFDPRRIRLADIDGSGVTDIIYLHREGVRLYFNLSGNCWSDAETLKIFPRVDNLSSVTVVDLLGNGTACLVWSSPLLGDARQSMRYVDLMGGQKPHLMVKMANNLGAETHVQYAPSTKFYLADKRAGKPWITRLPFPVHVVERVETHDRISRNRFVTRYAYHHGYFDGIEREFRGFGMVEQWDTEEFAALSASSAFPNASNLDSASHVPPIYTKTWFHTGVFTSEECISKQFEKEYYHEGDSSMEISGLSGEQLEAMLLPDTLFPATQLLADGTRIPYKLTVEELREASRSLKGSILRMEIFAQDNTEESDRPYSVSERNYTIELLQPRRGNKYAVFFTHARESIDFHYERKLYSVTNETFVADGAAGATPRGAKEAKTFPPRNAEYTEIRRKNFSATLGDFGEVRRASFSGLVPARPRWELDGKMLADPRVTHNLTLEVDNYGNVLRSASIGYGRRLQDPELSPEDQKQQQRTHITFTENAFTNPVLEADAYRVPLLCESRTYELLKVRPSSQLCGVTNLFRFDELKAQIAAVNDGAADLPYEQWDADESVLAGPRRRLIEHVRTLFLKNDLSGPLPLGNLESLGLPFESYRLAFTPSLLTELYGERVNEAMLAEGGYVQDEMGWWVPSGRIFYSPDKDDAPEVELDYAQHRFFLPLRYRSPFGAITIVTYDRYDLLTQEMRDAVGNLITAGERDDDGRLVIVGNDYRVLQPRLMMDANRNRASVAFDALGLVVGTAVMGKPEEHLGDSLDGFVADPNNELVSAYLADPLADPYSLLQDATTRLVYDLFAYSRTRNNSQPQPPLVATLIRETHTADLVNEQRTKVQHSFSYSDGFGREIQKKAQAEPGPLEDGGAEVNPRWVGSGWTIFNNKGKPVRQYEPFFSSTHHFEFAKQVGVSSVLFYDPVERVVATLHPNDSWEKVVFDPWRQETWDVNDTVLRDPRDDVDVGGYVKRYVDGLSSRLGSWRTWYAQRVDGALGRQEQRAAEKTATHADTPVRAWFDSLGRTILTVAHNRMSRDSAVVEERYATRTLLDIEGNQREVIDALGRSVMRYGFDMLGNALHQVSMESGTRWILNDVGNSSIYTWNSRVFRLHMEYDNLRRPVRQWVRDESGHDLLTERTVYGEAHPGATALNLRGKSYYQFDGAGVVRHDRYDFKGNLLLSTRRLSREYRQNVTWAKLETQFNTAQLDVEAIEAELSSLLEGDEWRGETTYDAHNRPVALTSPDASMIYLVYNEANLLERLDVKLRGADAAKPFITDIDYNARGQRQSITYGNKTKTSYTYDPLTFRLTHLETLRGESALQDFQYTYDPAGNITSVVDGVQPLVYFDNAVVSANADYVYDAVYQLIEATGREHIGLAAMPQPSWDDAPRTHLPHRNDGQALRRYSEKYRYDQVGNLLEMIHTATGGNWRRKYDYAEPSLLELNRPNNRLSSTTVGNVTETYHYDQHGNTTSMPHLREFNWDHEDQLQSVDLGGGGRAYYQYDTAGRRVRKVFERQNGTRQKERIYVGGFENYREYAGDGETIKLERQTLHIVDDKQRVALVETKTFDSEAPAETPRPLVRYQLSNDLGSTTVELDNGAAIISYEEYYPYGGTSYQAGRSNVEVSQKRYRYTGKERDEETGFYYHGARYYTPWLGRWISCDPAGLVDGSNVYRYVKNNPINATDPTGMWEWPSWRTVAVVAAVVVVGTVVTVATAGAAGPLVVGAVASIGLSGTAATVATGVAVGAIAGAVGGAAAGAAGEATRQTVNSRALGLGNEEFSGGRILSAAGEGAVTGAAVGAAVGGVTAFAATAAGAAAIGAVGRVAERAVPAAIRSGATIVARGTTAAARVVAQRTGVQALSRASERLGIQAAQGVFREGSRGAQAVARYAQTGSFARTFGADEASQQATAASQQAATTANSSSANATTQTAQTWQQQEALVTQNLAAQNPGVNIGRQVTLDVTGPAGRTVTIRIDNLVPTNGSFQLVDAKFSAVTNLANPATNLSNTVTANQRVVYSWISSGQPVTVIPRGANAVAAGLTPGTPITVNPSVQIHVNSPTGIVVRNY
ncbi:MAG: toxin [candidate division KSB1 bacterium]|nr:toxin [candidate division KSB1 bacterium]MDZ7368829.1 toxin [candidate division KSB1 bacterium]MDZ7406673.1 toxin [candidate division KSB1 bacterium]